MENPIIEEHNTHLSPLVLKDKRDCEKGRKHLQGM